MGRNHDFPSKLICLTGPKLFVEEPFSAVLQYFSGSENEYGHEEEEYQDIPSKTFCLTNAQFFAGDPCVSKKNVSKRLMDRRAESYGV